MTGAKLKLIAVVLLGAALVAVLWFQPFATPAQRAEASGRRLQPLLRSLSGAHVGASVCTSGLIEIKGSVSSDDGALQMMAIVKESKPSCDIEIAVEVYPQDQPCDGAEHVRGYYRPDGASGLEISKPPYSAYVPLTQASGANNQ